MNADPHLGNFHYNDATGTIGLVDFGNCKYIDPADARFVAQQVRVAVRVSVSVRVRVRVRSRAWLNLGQGSV